VLSYFVHESNIQSLVSNEEEQDLDG